MTDFFSKMQSQSNLHNSVLDSSHTPRAHQHAIVKTYGGKNLNLKANQIPDVDIHRNCNWWRYSSKSDLSTMISNGSQAHIQLDRGSGSGHVKAVWLRLQIYNGTGSAVGLVNMAHLLNEIEFQTPSGQQIQVINGSDLWNLICRMHTIDEFGRLAKLINSSKLYGKGPLIANGATKTFYLPIMTNFLENSQFFVTAVDGDLNCYVRFRSSTSTVISGSAPTLQDLSLEVQMEQLDSRRRSEHIQKYRSMVHHYFLPYIRRQTVSQTLSAATTYSINLSSIKGDIVWLDFFIRQSATGHGLRNYAPIASFSLLNNEGDQITGQNNITSDFNRFIQQPTYFPSHYSEYANIYSFVFGIEDHGAVNLILNGSKAGHYPFTTYERLEFTTAASGTNEVQTINESGIPAGGSWQIEWITPTSYERTGVIAYNADTAAIKAAIEALTSFDGTVTAGAALSAGACALTFGGNYGYKPMWSEGYYFNAIPYVLVTSAPAAVELTAVITTPGVEGFNSGASHTIEIVGYSTSLLTLAPNGQIDVRNT